MRLLLMFVLTAFGVAEARTIERTVAWNALPADLAGREVSIERRGASKVRGRVERAGSDGIELRSGKGVVSLGRADVASVTWKERKRVRWRIVGTAAGAAPGILVTSWAVTLHRNEGGIYGPRNIGIASAILAGGAVLGFFAGREADTDTFVLRIVGE